MFPRSDEQSSIYQDLDSMLSLSESQFSLAKPEANVNC
jgi:hypothetical protein